MARFDGPQGRGYRRQLGRLSALDQMRRMQINSSVGGECAPDTVLENENSRAPQSQLGTTAVANPTHVALSG